jgi:hypothetical protein
MTDPYSLLAFAHFLVLVYRKDVPRMSSADHYRTRAAEFAAMARSQSVPTLQVEYARMAANYLRLAELADRNSQTDVVYEPPPLQNPRTR